MFEDPGVWDVLHVSLAKRADILVVAPTTANCLGKVAHGIADDLLTTVVMATKAPVLLVPSMNDAMYLNPVVRRNIKDLRTLGYNVMELSLIHIYSVQIYEVVKQDEPIGRRLEFLVQEMQREVNTIGSKAQDSEISHRVVDIKSELEKIREQIQNIE